MKSRSCFSLPALINMNKGPYGDPDHYHVDKITYLDFSFRIFIRTNLQYNHSGPLFPSLTAFQIISICEIVRIDGIKFGRKRKTCNRNAQCSSRHQCGVCCVVTISFLHHNHKLNSETFSYSWTSLAFKLLASCLDVASTMLFSLQII
jgi:hypothetical protein